MKEIIVTDSYVLKSPSFERFSKLQRDIKESEEDDILLILNIEKRLGLTFVFLFSTIPYLAKEYNKNIAIYMNEKTFILFKKIGFFKKEDYKKEHDYTNSIISGSNVIVADTDVFKTVTEITEEAPVKMSSELSSLFISKAGEMYNNAIEHSGGKVFGAKYFKYQKNTYCFACYDTGVGIPQKVMSVVSSISSQTEAFKWAMKRGNSTVLSGIPRGLGLDLLNGFAQANEGRIRICSGKVLYLYSNKDGVKITELNNEFKGTLFEMDIVADNSHRYILG